MKKLFAFLLMTGMITFTSCSKKNDAAPASSSNNNSSGTVTIDSSPRITGKLDGVAYSKVEDGTNVVSMVSREGSLAAYPDTSTGIYGCGFTNGDGSVSYFAIDRGTLKYVGTVENTDFKAYYTPATYSYNLNLATGIRVIYYDAAGEIWSTDQGSQNQSGSTFVITDRKEFSGLSGYDIKVKATFNCKLYNTTGQVKTFTEGVFVGFFENM